MDITDIDDDRVLDLLRRELDRREHEKQDLCEHFRSGTIRNTGVNSFDVVCDDCGKVMGEEERKNAYGSKKQLPLTDFESQTAKKEYVQKNKERGLD
jgi:hypothetical protein